MESRRHASKPYNLSLFLGHSKGQILKKYYAQGWRFARSTSSTSYFFLLFQAWGCSNFVKNCSNFVKTRSATTFGTNNAEPISELYFGGLGGADRHTRSTIFWPESGNCDLISYERK